MNITIGYRALYRGRQRGRVILRHADVGGAPMTSASSA
jgi:hypothetical protein